MFSLLFTPAGDEPDALFAHVDRVAALIDRPVIRSAESVVGLLDRTSRRVAESASTLVYAANQDRTVYPGWKRRPIRSCWPWVCARTKRTGRACMAIPRTYRYPLREWNWEPRRRWCATLDARGIQPPKRTNCRLCYGQRLDEWWELWKTDPAVYARGELLRNASRSYVSIAGPGHLARRAERVTRPVRSGGHSTRRGHPTGTVWGIRTVSRLPRLAKGAQSTETRTEGAIGGAEIVKRESE